MTNALTKAGARSKPGDFIEMGFRPDIQGLRAIAVALVVLYHAGVPGFHGGYIGVDIFFVISGCLITSHLLKSLATTGTIRFGEFYARRMRRILPAAIVVVIASVIAAIVFLPPLLVGDALTEAVATILYVPNLLFAYQGTDYLSEDSVSIFQQYWSLGVEEQFYVFWPLVLLTVFVLVRRSRARLGVVLGLIGVASLLLSIVVTSVSQPWAFFGLPTRVWEFVAGGLVALVLGSPRWRLNPRIAVAVSWASIAVLAYAAATFTSSTPFPGWIAIIPVAATAALLLVGGAEARFSAQIFLNRAPMQFLGKVSYSVYLVHWPLIMVPVIALSASGTDVPWIPVAMAILSIPVGWALYAAVESPLRQLSYLRTRRPWVTFASTLTAMAVVIAMCGAYFFVDRGRPLASNEAAPALIDTSPAGTAFVPSNMDPDLRSAESDNPVLYGDGCNLPETATTVRWDCVYGSDTASSSIAIFGDSHAAQWFPAILEIAEKRDASVTSFTKARCSSVDVEKMFQGRPYSECDAWREEVIEKLVSDPPDLVVLSNFGSGELRDTSRTFNAIWADGLEATVSRLSAVTHVVVIADTPSGNIDPLVCLSANLTSAHTCDRPRSESVNSELTDIERRVTASAGGDFVDMTEYFCNDETCPVVIGNALVTRDRHHITASMSRLLAPALEQELSASDGQRYADR
ncbi:acyltransferase [Agromyces atrinae]|uniref:acyltransferase family protein n=1 Tax=Agromyces atrinae TaxID=592376 RepID=UPI001F5A8FB3|nr:acyltransferase family protein [Agromyces atrinae]MCI2956076.1 acyltransferase [Agromyces atrinae]